MGVSKLVVPVAALALVSTPLRAQAADEPIEMVPLSRWVLDYADNSCALRRAFGDGDEQVMLELRRYVPLETFEVALVSSTLERTNVPLKVRFEPDTGWYDPSQVLELSDREMTGYLYTDSLLPKGPRLTKDAVIWSDDVRNAREEAIAGLVVATGFDRAFVLRTGAMHKPMEGMRACMDELLIGWGLDPVAQRTLSRAASPINRAAWVGRIGQSYPADMVRADRSARVRIRLVVGADGRPKSCHSEHADVAGRFVDTACAITMQTARFEPALDAQGMPVASYYWTTISYVLSN